MVIKEKDGLKRLAYVCVCVYAYICAREYMCWCVYIGIHAHTHTPTRVGVIKGERKKNVITYNLYKCS